ncbi:MAG TPA: hypothetical protein VGL39_03115 [Jatrophihabitantaceae bacterium]
MRADPLRAVPTSARIWLASLLSVLPLGTTWSIQPGMFLPTPVLPGLCNPDTGFCTPDIPTAGILAPGSTELVSQSPARVMLVFSAAALFFVATRIRTEHTRIVAQVACLSLGVAAVLAAAHAAATTLLCALTALGLVAPPAWRGHQSHRSHQARNGGGLAPTGRSA